jgi:hypothetical protein
MLSQQFQSRMQGFKIAVAFLSVNERIERHPSSAGFAWLFKTYVPWNAVAIALAELYNQPQGPLADHAWEIIQSRFQDWEGRVADIKEAMVWGLIKNLLRLALAEKQHNQELSRARQGFDTAALDSVLQGHDASSAGLEGGKGSSIFYPQSFENFGPIDRNRDQPLSFAAINMVEADIESPNASNNSNNWNDLIFDVDALGGESILEPYGIQLGFS